MISQLYSPVIKKNGSPRTHTATACRKNVPSNYPQHETRLQASSPETTAAVFSDGSLLENQSGRVEIDRNVHKYTYKYIYIYIWLYTYVVYLHIPDWWITPIYTRSVSNDIQSTCCLSWGCISSSIRQTPIKGQKTTASWRVHVSLTDKRLEDHPNPYLVL